MTAAYPVSAAPQRNSRLNLTGHLPLPGSASRLPIAFSSEVDTGLVPRMALHRRPGFDREIEVRRPCTVRPDHRLGRPVSDACFKNIQLQRERRQRHLEVVQLLSARIPRSHRMAPTYATGHAVIVGTPPGRVKPRMMAQIKSRPQATAVTQSAGPPPGGPSRSWRALKTETDPRLRRKYILRSRASGRRFCTPPPLKRPCQHIN